MTFAIGEGVLGTYNGRLIKQYTIANPNGMKFVCNEYGATVTNILAKDCDGVIEEVTLCYNSLDELISNSNPYYGCAVGRFANRFKPIIIIHIRYLISIYRVADGQFTLEGIEYNLKMNNGKNHLHGGIVGFSKCVWNSTIMNEGYRAGVKFMYTAADGEENYPGNVEVSYRNTVYK